MSSKKRLDVMMLEQGLAESREKAKALIMAGICLVDGERMDKAGTMIKDTAKITLKNKPKAYVSRGGLKLEKAIKEYEIDLQGLTCIDIGASTGGFTDCMLQNKASKVYAVDVGYGQLAWSLRTDERVVNLERTNIRYLTREQIPELCDFATIDVSFISLTLVLPILWEYLKPDGRSVILVKPQFEAGREKVGKKGVVRDPEVHLEVVDKILYFLANNKFKTMAINFSPIKGPEGNIEYLFYIKKSDEPSDITKEDTNLLVKQSHAALASKKGEE